MSKKKHKQATGIAGILKALENQPPGTGKKRTRDGSPKASGNTTVKADEDAGKHSNRMDAEEPAGKRVRVSSAPKSGVQPPGPPTLGSVSLGGPPKSSRQQNASHPSVTLPQRNFAEAKQSQPKNQSNVPPHLLRRRDALLSIRESLPIWPHAKSIRDALRKNSILVLTGETGSGKSTQVPQFLISEPWCTKCIAVTQPRRVAAISLARRVAEEMGSFMGGQSPAAKVGYSVRFDNATGPNTKVKFLTEGMLLQEILRDPELEQYSAIVVDEVHERSVNVDLILGFLRNLISELEKGKTRKRKTPLKVVVMSATADVESLVQFFDGGLKLTKNVEAGAEYATSPMTTSSVASNPSSSGEISTCFVEGRQYPVKTIYLPEPTQDWVEGALRLIFQIHYKEPLPGDILVFLTGQDTIENLEKLVNDYAENMDKEVPKVCAILSSTNRLCQLYI
jgi:ATP-dependent RNA helicase DHR2